MGFVNAVLDLYRLAPGFLLWVVPVLLSGYVAFLWSGYALGKWMHQAEIAGLKSANDASKAQNDALKAQNDIGKERAIVMEERLKLAKDQAEDAKNKSAELQRELAILKEKVDREPEGLRFRAAVAHADLKVSNIAAANNAVVSILNYPTVSSRHTRIDVRSEQE
jgi:hypothetical protein